MKAFNYLPPVILLLLSACNSNEDHSYTIHIKVVPPEANPELTFEGIKVTLTNQEQGTTYSTLCSSDGIATLEVEYGHYTASVHYQTPSGVIFSGSVESISLLPGQTEMPEAIEIPLVKSQTSALIIKEIFYTGHSLASGSNYKYDQYVTLYNNSDATIYLDGLCVGVVDPANSQKSPWMKYTDMSRIPISDFTWQFPGNGQEYPLLPGTETTIATNAVDHTSGEYNHPESIDLSHVDWGFWDENLEQVMAPGVKPMKLIANFNSDRWIYDFPVAGLTFIIFNIDNAEAYVSNPENRSMRPQSTIPTTYLMIPKEWVIDCVECVEDASNLTNKRVPTDMDYEPIYVPDGIYSGKSVIRKKATTGDSQLHYQDTNNSAADMEVSEPSLKNK